MPDFDRPYMTAWEAVSFVAYGIAAGDGGKQWREQNRDAHEDVDLASMNRLMRACQRIGEAAAGSDITVKGCRYSFGNLEPIPADHWLKPGGGCRLIDLTGRDGLGTLDTPPPWYDLRFDPREIFETLGSLDDSPLAAITERLRAAGEMKPETIAKMKTDFDQVEHFLDQSGIRGKKGAIKKAASQAAASTERNWQSFARQHRRWREHQRQNGKK